MPEEIFLKILGSRKPVLFVEGEKASLDYFFFAHLFPTFTVIPRGSCDQVIQSTTSFNASANLHTIQACGLLDRDEKSSEELQFLRTKKVFALEVCEIENLLLTQDAICAIARALRFPVLEPIVQQAQTIVLNELSREKERVISKLTAFKIEAQLKKFDNKALGQQDLELSLTAHIAGIKVSEMYEEQRAHVEGILQRQDYGEALKIFGNKGLLSKIASTCFSMKRDDFVDLVKRIILKDDVGLLSALKNRVPAIN